MIIEGDESTDDKRERDHEKKVRGRQGPLIIEGDESKRELIIERDKEIERVYEVIDHVGKFETATTASATTATKTATCYWYYYS